MDENAKPRADDDTKSPLEELRDRLLEWVGELLHPPVLVPVPVPRRPSR